MSGSDGVLSESHLWVNDFRERSRALDEQH